MQRASEPAAPAAELSVKSSKPAPAPQAASKLKAKPEEPTVTPEIPRGKTGTLLGLPKIDEATAETPVAPASQADSERRTTKPLKVQNAAQAAGLNVAPPVPVPVPPTAPPRPTRKTPAPPAAQLPPMVVGRSDGEDGQTEPQPRVDPNDFDGGDTRDEDFNDLRGAMSHPVLDPQSATPAIPTMALPPMPAKPESTSFVGATFQSVRYLWPLMRAVWARRQAQKSIRELLHGDQRLLDQVLRDLGRAAREENLDAPVIADEMKRVHAEEARRAAADQAIVDADKAANEENERWQLDEGERTAAITAREGDLRECEQELKLKGDERRIHEAERARLDGEVRGAEKRAAAADARALKADTTPPEKGGGPNTAANARAEAAAARKDAAERTPARDAAAAEVQKLDGPIDVLSKRIVELRSEVMQRKKQLADALAAHRKTLAEHDAAKKAAEREREAAEREMSQRFVAAGTLLNLNRIDGPKFAPHYARIDEVKNGVNAREAAIVRLESERRSYDRDAVQRGLITVGVIVALLAILGIVLAVLLSR
jgi:hypothetical protein